MKTDTPVAGGDRAYATWLRGKTTRYLLVYLAAVYTCTVAVTSIRGIGSLVQVFSEFGIDEGGQVTVVDPRALLAASEALRPSAGANSRVTSVGTQTTTLYELIKVPFELLYAGGAGVPNETRYRERDTSLDTKFFVTMAGSLSGLINGGTATLTGVTFKAQQYFDDSPSAKTPLFKPGWKQLKLDVPAANTQLQLDLNLSSIVRGITIVTVSNIGVVSDIVNSFRLFGTNREYIGKGSKIDARMFLLGREFDEGGNITSVGQLAAAGAAGGFGMVHIPLQEFGMLSNCLNPYQDSNFTLEFDAQPTVAGASASQIIVLLHTLERDVFLRSDKRYVTAPNEEFAKRAPGLIALPSAA